MITFIESPYFGIKDSCRYLACCILDVFQRGEIPFASHGLYPLGLPEKVEIEDHLLEGHKTVGKLGRDLGISAAKRMKSQLDGYGVPFKVAFYCDIGAPSGMPTARDEALDRNYSTEDRTLTGQAKRIWIAGEWPTMARLTHNHEVKA